MVRFVLLAHTFENFDRVGKGRLFNLDRLETTLKSRIFLDVLAVLVKSCCADGLKFAASQHRLQDRCSIDCTLSCSSTDERVNFVDEQDDVTTGVDLFEHLLETLLEVTAIAGTCDKRTEVEGVELLVSKRVWNIVVNDALCKAFNDCGLTNTWLTDEHRVVLRAARKNLHHSFELGCSADHRVERVFTSHLSEIASELIEDLTVLVVTVRF